MSLVEQLAATPCKVTVLPEILRQGHPVFVLRDVTKPVQVAVDSGRGWPEPCHNRSPRRMAQRRGTISLLEQHTLSGKFIDIWCLRLGMPTKTPHPVVQIIDSDEKDVGWFAFGKPMANQQLKAKTRDGRFHVMVIRGSAGRIRCGMEVGEPDSLRRQAVEHRCLHWSAITAEPPGTQIISQQDNDTGPVIPCVGVHLFDSRCRGKEKCDHRDV